MSFYQRNKLCLLCFLYTQVNKTVHLKIVSGEMLFTIELELEPYEPYELASRSRNKKLPDNIETRPLVTSIMACLHEISRQDKLTLTLQTLDKFVKEISSNIKRT